MTIAIRLPPPYSAQEDFVYWKEKNPKAQVLVAPAGIKTGKALDVETPILTTEGFKRMGDIQVGDYVYSEHGRPIRVLGTSGILKDRPCYEVFFSDKTSIVCDEGHLWETSTLLERRKGARSGERFFGVRTTKEIYESLTHGGYPNHSIPNLTQLELAEKNLLVHPYVFGVWLGDGTKSRGHITTPDSFILNKINALGYETNHVESSEYTYNVVGLITQLRHLGVLNTRDIPEDYLLGSYQQRLDLLHGLFDTDGTCSKGNGEASFDTTDKTIFDAVCFLLHSFGEKFAHSTRIGKLNGEEKKLCYRIWLRSDTPLFSLPRKLALQAPKKKPKHRFIYAVEKVPTRPVQCITVDNPTHLFLAGRQLVPTHNSFGASLWLAKEALVYPGLYCIWIAPTYMKAKIGFRYMKYMLPDHPSIKLIESRHEIYLGNGTIIKFIHGQDAETTIEGEAVDRFVIDESGKQTKQLWFSLLTTITQTKGIGIVTGTPRGFTWYYDVYKRAKDPKDPFFCLVQMKTANSPYVEKSTVENARRLLPRHLFLQYLEAQFVTMSMVFSNLDMMFDSTLKVTERNEKFWVHPDIEQRKGEIVTGWDMAKLQDYSVFYSLNLEGKLVGYARFRRQPYGVQVKRLKEYLHRFFPDERILLYDGTGVGVAVGDMIVEEDIDATCRPLVFTQRSKMEMVSKLAIAIESGWHRAPRIERIAHELATYEVTATSSGLFRYSAPDGEHDDIVSAAMMAVSTAFDLSGVTAAEELMEKYLQGEVENMDDIEQQDPLEIDPAYTETEEDDFFLSGEEDSFELNYRDV